MSKPTRMFGCNFSRHQTGNGAEREVVLASDYDALAAERNELLGLLRMTSRILRSDDPAISDTVWCDDGAPETLADRIDAALAKHPQAEEGDT